MTKTNIINDDYLLSKNQLIYYLSDFILMYKILVHIFKSIERIVISILFFFEKRFVFNCLYDTIIFRIV